MLSPLLEDLDADVRRAPSVPASVSVFVRGLTTQMEAAIAEALASGARVVELAHVQALVDALKASHDVIVTAVSKNT